MTQSWYLLDAGVELGPFEQSQLVAMAQSGRITPSDLIRSNKMTSPIVARRVKGLFPSTTTRSSNESALPSKPDAEVVSVLRDTGNAIGGLARQKAIELQELPQADFVLGRKALEIGFSSTKTAETLLAIRDIEEQIKQLRDSAKPVDAHATLTDRASGLAQTVKSKFNIETLVQRRKHKVVELGTAIRMHPREGNTQPLLAEIKAARSLHLELEKLRESTRRSRPLQKLKRYAMAAFVACGLGATLWIFRGPLASSMDLTASRTDFGQDNVATARFGASADTLSPHEEALRERELELESRRQKLAEDKARKQAEQEIALKEKALADEEARIVAAEAEAKQREIEEARKAVEAERLAKEAARFKAESKREAAIAQETRKQLAESLFAPLSLDPARYITLSSKLTAMGVSLEIRGEKVPQIKTLLESKDYLGLINFFHATQVTEYPDAAIIRNVHDRLMNAQFVILVKSERPLKIGYRYPYLLHIRFLDSNDTKIAYVDSSWDTHPDGIGYIGEWRLSYGASVLCYGESRKYHQALRTLQSGVSNTLKSLQAKQQLGEIGQEVVDERRKELVIEAQAKVRTASLAL